MADQITSELGNYLGCNIFVLFLLLAAAKWPRVARSLFSVMFVGAGVWNLFASLTMPQFYLETYGHLATPLYAAFIYGPFAVDPALFVVPIAIGELAIGILATGTGRALQVGMVGSMIFLLAIAPMGVGSAFPFSLFGILAAYLLFRRPLGTTLFQDAATAFAAMRRAPPRGHARPPA
jgi:hypothetical protein